MPANNITEINAHNGEIFLKRTLNGSSEGTVLEILAMNPHITRFDQGMPHLWAFIFIDLMQAILLWVSRSDRQKHAQLIWMFHVRFEWLHISSWFQMRYFEVVDDKIVIFALLTVLEDNCLPFIWHRVLFAFQVQSWGGRKYVATYACFVATLCLQHIGRSTFVNLISINFATGASVWCSSGDLIWEQWSSKALSFHCFHFTISVHYDPWNLLKMNDENEEDGRGRGLRCVS